MIDITKEEFWDNKESQVNKVNNKNSKVKDFIIRNKMITILVVGLGLLMTINTVLVYNFFKILTNI